MKKLLLGSKGLCAEVVSVLRNGGLLMHPTETCYGLAVDVFNKAALEKLYKVKKMALDKPVSILVGSLEMALKYGEFSGRALELAERFWPGPLSIVVPRKVSLPEFLNPGADFVSVRFSSLPFCSEMVLSLGRPVTTTSANVSGKTQLYEPEVVGLGGVDFVVDGGVIVENKPSTIVKVVGDEVTILRKGDVLV